MALSIISGGVLAILAWLPAMFGQLFALDGAALLGSLASIGFVMLCVYGAGTRFDNGEEQPDTARVALEVFGAVVDEPAASDAPDDAESEAEAEAEASAPPVTGTLPLPGGEHATFVKGTTTLTLSLALPGLPIDVRGTDAIVTEDEGDEEGEPDAGAPDDPTEDEITPIDPDTGDTGFDDATIVTAHAGLDGPTAAWLPEPIRVVALELIKAGARIERGTLALDVTTDDPSSLHDLAEISMRLSALALLVRRHVDRGVAGRIAHVLTYEVSDDHRIALIEATALAGGPACLAGLTQWVEEGAGSTRALAAAGLDEPARSTWLEKLAEDVHADPVEHARVLQLWLDRSPATAAAYVAAHLELEALPAVAILARGPGPRTPALVEALIEAEVPPHAGPIAAWLVADASHPAAERTMVQWIEAADRPDPHTIEALEQVAIRTGSLRLKHLAERTATRMRAELVTRREQVRGSLAVAETPDSGGLSTAEVGPDEGALSRQAASRRPEGQ